MTTTTVTDLAAEIRDDGGDVTHKKDVQSEKEDSGMDETLGSADLTMRSDDEDYVIPKKHSKAKQMVFDDDDDDLTGPEGCAEIPSNSTVPLTMPQEALEKQAAVSVQDDSDDDGPFPRLTIVEEDDVEDSRQHTAMNILQNRDLFDAEESDGEPAKEQDSNGEEEEGGDREDRGGHDEEDEGFSDSEIDPALLRKLKKIKGAARKAKGKKAPPKDQRQDDLLHLHSETQRLIRESRVSLPYHQPTPKSLDDFLARAKKKQQEYHALRGAPDIRKAEVIQQVIGTTTPASKKSRGKKAHSPEGKEQEFSQGEDGLPMLKSSRSKKPTSASRRLQNLGDFELPDLDTLQSPTQPSSSSQPLASSYPGLFDDEMDDDDDLPDVFPVGNTESTAADMRSLNGEGSSKEQLTEPEKTEALSFAPAEDQIPADQDMLVVGVESKDSTDALIHNDSIHTEDPLSLKQASTQPDSGVDITSHRTPKSPSPEETSAIQQRAAKLPSSPGISCSEENPLDSASVHTNTGSQSGTVTPKIGSVSEDMFGDMDRPSTSHLNIIDLDSDCEIPCGQGIPTPVESSSKHSQDFKSQSESARRMQEWLSEVQSATQSRGSGHSDGERPGPSQPRHSTAARLDLLKDLGLHDIQPKLSGDPNSFIVLDEDDKKEQDGPFKHPGTPSFKTDGHSQRQPKDITISIVEKDYSRREDGELTVKTVTYHPDPTPIVLDDKPGSKLYRLQERLAAEMRVKREEARKKRMERYALENEEGFEIGGGAELEEEMEEEEMTDESDTDIEDEDELEEEEFVKEKKRPKNPYVCEEADEDDEDYVPDENAAEDEDEDSGDDEKEDEENEKSANDEDADENSEPEEDSVLQFDQSDDEDVEMKEQPGKKSSQRTFKKPKTYVISDDDESVDADPSKSDNVDLESEMSPMHQLMANSPEEKKDEKKEDASERSPLVSFKSLESLMATPSQTQEGNRLLMLPSASSRLLQSLPAPSTQDINEMLGLGLGSQSKATHPRRSLPFVLNKAQAAADDNKAQAAADDNMDELLELCSGNFSTQKSQTQSKRKLEDDEGEDDEGEDDRSSLVSFHISEGEMEDNSENEELDGSDKENVDNDKSENDADEDDESRQSELSEEESEEKFGGFTVNNRHGKIRREFVDDEAELSGSEYESDENEDLAEEDDIMEEEEGDTEQLREDELREQVGRVHLKRLLDEDKRELLRYQEMYLPDGDLYSGGKGRMRRFAWRNMDDSSQKDMFEDSEEEDQSHEDPEELAWRKERFERQKFLKEHEQPESEEQSEGGVKLQKFGQAFLHNSTAFRSLKQKAKGAPSREDKQMTPPKKGQLAKGSLLSRGREHLNRLAEITKAPTNQSKASASGNFVFQVLSPSKQSVDVEAPQSQPEVKKRIAHEPPAKKPKLETPRLDRQSSLFSSLEKRKTFSL